ncbi:tRNA (adenosine(37)-N6)-threonylcarbamoyltransferase complex dimerization subunit type 1 TsaB, partial [Marinobacter sp.]
MKLLALDTSSEGCSAALWLDGRVTERFEVAPRGHTRLLMPMVRELFAEQGLSPTDLDALAFARGPGSFTGLRIATGVVQGLAWGLDIPVVPVSSLAAVALAAIETHALQEG